MAIRKPNGYSIRFAMFICTGFAIPNIVRLYQNNFEVVENENDHQAILASLERLLTDEEHARVVREEHGLDYDTLKAAYEESKKPEGSKALTEVREPHYYPLIKVAA